LSIEYPVSVISKRKKAVEYQKQIGVSIMTIGNFISFGKYDWRVLDEQDSKVEIITENIGYMKSLKMTPR